ncbi:DNA cytosine methyltransferase [Chitinophaga oryzae]|uniref:DNA (cytosine-5-)-methyltransferase n=1 Tax=Chitinophaga oryzae TaxID=2725414 RepID=A0AAE6ZNX7_9BACT|nr:DNA cytosine methyltransferase [Chitinophaga oryzae]QJB34880.1 DNA cytosine methyltransferase [Chitinophaga oryzae]QJB41391.1 DNA cytosine methyltransferase [Chitinophaga oryzae]
MFILDGKGMKKKRIRHGSLFSGIGGFDLAADWCGWETVFHCEVDVFCQKILHHYWPHAATIGDIEKHEWKKWRGKIDVLSGGWPCQKYSVAGSRIGSEPLKEVLLDVVDAVRPAWAVLENVFGFITKKFAAEHDRLCQRLETMGYEVQTFCIDAASCGVPTMERHVWIVATSTCQRRKRLDKKQIQNITGAPLLLPGGDPGVFDRWALSESRVCNVGEGVSGRLDIETIRAKVWHAKSLKALGNAIVPQIAYYIFSAINETIN